MGVSRSSKVDQRAAIILGFGVPFVILVLKTLGFI